MKILLSEIMYSKKLTIRQVSYLTGIPRLDTLEDIARGLNLRISDLYESDIK